MAEGALILSPGAVGQGRCPTGRLCSGSHPGATSSHQGPALGQSEGLVPTWLSQGLALRSRNPRAGDTGFPRIPAEPPGPSLVEDMLPLGTSHPQTHSEELGLFSLALQDRSLNISNAWFSLMGTRIVSPMVRGPASSQSHSP